MFSFSPSVAPDIGKTGRPDGYDGGHPPQQLRLSYGVVVDCKCHGEMDDLMGFNVVKTMPCLHP